MNDFDMSQLTPEQLQSLMELGILDEQGGQLDEQMAQAQALAQPIGGGHTTPVGAALGGLGDLLRAGGAGLKEQKLRGQKDDLLRKKMLGRMDYGDLMRGVQRSSPDEWANPFGGY